VAISPLIRFGTSTWTYEGWQGQIYKREYKKTLQIGGKVSMEMHEVHETVPSE
jgi:uncharacterized protein YecE (DUF72 family)